MRLLKNTLAGLLLIAGLGCGNQGKPAKNPEAKRLKVKEKVAAEQAALWTTTIKTEEGKFTFGGPLRPEEKPLVGRWRGSNNRKEFPDNWEIVRRPNHTYSLSIAWMDEGERQSAYTHGLWQVMDGKFQFADILDKDMELEEDWPIEVKGRIPSNDLVVQTEELKSANEGKVITTSIEEGQTITHTEVSVKEFKRRFNEVDVRAEGLIFDQIQRARITNFAGVADYFNEPLTAEEKKLVGRWSGSNTDPDNPGRWEFIRRPDRTGTIAYANEGDEPEEITLAHGLWKLRHGKFIFSELTEGKKIMPWGEISLGDESVIQVADDQFVTEWIDPERRVLGGLFARRVRNTEKRVQEFKLPPMKSFSKADPFDSAAFLKKVRATERKLPKRDPGGEASKNGPLPKKSP